MPEDRMNESHYLSAYWKKMFRTASEKSVSDIHIEPNEPEPGKMAVRFGIMNSLIIYDIISDSDTIPSYLNRLEYICGLDVTRKHVRQDRSIELPSFKSRYRVSYGPPSSMDPESIVFRVIEEKALPDLDRCYLPGHFEQDLKEFLKMEQGFFITTGPTGSGKSTTCQAALMSIDRKTKKVISLEDPVERSLPWVRQYEITPTFSWEEGISTILRQKPVVCLIGEIRDSKSGFAALEAANKGHLVISTLHANSVSDTYKQLIKKFKFDYLDIQSVSLCAAQRLVQILCPHCRVKNMERGQYRKGQGCDMCQHLVPGVSGLRPIFEHCFRPTEDDVEEFRQSGIFPVRSTLRQELRKLIDQGLADYTTENMFG